MALFNMFKRKKKNKSKRILEGQAIVISNEFARQAGTAFMQYLENQDLMNERAGKNLNSFIYGLFDTAKTLGGDFIESNEKLSRLALGDDGFDQIQTEESLRDEISNITLTVNRLEEKNDELAGEADTLRGLIASLESQLKEEQEKVEKMQTKNREYHSQVVSLSSELESSQNEADSLRLELKDAKEASGAATG